MPGKLDLPSKVCKTCGTMFNRKVFSGRLEDATVYSKREHCSRTCGNSREEIMKQLNSYAGLQNGRAEQRYGAQQPTAGQTRQENDPEFEALVYEIAALIRDDKLPEGFVYKFDD